MPPPLKHVRLGAVSYLNARPCVVGLDKNPRFQLRFDLPARCATLLHEASIDVGLVPSIEYLRGPNGADGYRIVPEVAIASDGQVASVALYTTRAIADVRSIALDTSSRTSVALTRVLCARVWQIDPDFEPLGPNLEAMLDRCDAALIIGDAALFVDHTKTRVAAGRVEKIDLGETWTNATGLPFVYAFWAGWPGVLNADDVADVQAARDAGVAAPDRVATEYLTDSDQRSVGARYLRDNIKYELGERERAGVELFYRYAAELDLVPSPRGLKFF